MVTHFVLPYKEVDVILNGSSGERNQKLCVLAPMALVSQNDGREKGPSLLITYKVCALNIRYTKGFTQSS